MLLLIGKLLVAAVITVNAWTLDDTTYRDLVLTEFAADARNDQWVEAELIRCGAPRTDDPKCGFVYWAARYWWLVDRNDHEVLLRPNALQWAYLDHRGSENAILKYRRGGCSTLIGALYYWRALFQPNQQGYVMAHKADSTDELYKKTLFAHRKMQPWMRAVTRRSNRKELAFAHNDSGLRWLTAGGKGQGRAGDATMLHLSELAHYPDPDQVMAAIGETKRASAWVDIESTPNGWGRFRDEYRRARMHQSDRVAHFYPWFIDPLNVIALVPGETLTLCGDEVALADTHGLSMEQIKWRRGKRAELKELFPQEHPEDDETCFLTSGVPLFNVSVLRDLLQVIEENVVALDAQRVCPFGDDGGHFTVWIAPQPDHVYVIGSDIAEGVPGGAYTTAAVLDVETGDQCAAWHGHINPYDWGKDRLPRIGRWYNDALVAPERNNHGHATLAGLREAAYPHVYKHREYDHRTAMKARRPGWPTDGKTKPIMMGELRDCLDNGWMTVYDAEFVREAITMQAGDVDATDEDGPEEMRRRKRFTDRVIAWAIAWQVRKRGVPAVV